MADHETKAPAPAAPGTFAHALRHTFCEHDQVGQDKTHEWWMTNPDRLSCRYDGHPFEGPIFSRPVAYDLPSGKFTVTQIFCGPYCMAQFMDEQRDVPHGHAQLFGLMMHLIYAWPIDMRVPRAADIELLQRAPDDPHYVAIQPWRDLPKAHVSIRLTLPHMWPFRVQKRDIISHALRSHEGFSRLQEWNRTMAEHQFIPDVTMSGPGADIETVTEPKAPKRRAPAKSKPKVKKGIK
jgi:hypothetical protein